MILEHYPVERLKEEIKKVVNKHLPDKKYEIFFFGSRVDGTSNERSDIEVGILSDTEIEAEQYLDIQSDFFELPILYKIDFVNFNKVGDQFKLFAMKKTESIFSNG